MNPLKPLFLLVIALASKAPAETVLSVDFDSLDDGAVTAANLNGITSGASWFLNPNRGAIYEIQDSGGEQAILFDDPDFANSGTNLFAGLTLSEGIDLSSESVTFDFRTATRRTGNNKGLRFEFLNQAGNAVAATVDWFHGNTVSLNNGQATGSSGFTFLESWDPGSASVRDISITLAGNSVTLDFDGLSLAGVFQNPSSDIGRLRISTIGTAGGARGVFFDELSITTEPFASDATAVVATDFHYRGLAPADADFEEDRIRVYLPPASVTDSVDRPAILMFHGGGWTNGDASQFYKFCDAFARLGYVTASANYRFTSHSTARSFSDPKERCIADARLAAAWLQSNADTFGFAEDQIILGGGSAGGHLATMVALMPEELAAVTSNPISIPALILFNAAYHVSEVSPASAILVDPERQLAEYVEGGNPLPTSIHLYGNLDQWRTPGNFTNGSGNSEQGIGRGLPFIDSYRADGGEAQLWYAIGEGHSFFNGSDWMERSILQIESFLDERGFSSASSVPDVFARPELPLELGTALHAWRLEWFANEVNTGDAAELADPDDDGILNYVEFALGTNPLVPEPTAPTLLEPDFEASNLQFSRRLNKDPFADPAVATELESSVSLDPDSWFPMTIGPDNIIDVSDGFESISVHFEQTEQRRFFRLNLSLDN